MRKVADEPYWRSHVRVYRNGRVEWYGDSPDEDFWNETWQKRLVDGYFDGADQGNLMDLEDLLTGVLRHEGRHLEAGCGLGYWVAALRARGYRVEGIDSSEELVAAVHRTRPDLPVRHGDALAIEAPDETYDTYLSFGVIEHRQEGPEPFLNEAHRVVKTGGRVVLSVPYCNLLRRLKGTAGAYRRRPPLDLPFFQYGFGEVELRGFFASAGFSIDEVHYQYVHRCLVEEVPLYFRVNRMRGARHIHRALALVPSRLAGHLILVVATKVKDVAATQQGSIDSGESRRMKR